MAKVPVNKVKRAVKISYLGQKALHKMLFKSNFPVWPKLNEVEQEALLKVGAGVWANPDTYTVVEATASLAADVPAPTAGGFVEAAIKPENGFSLQIFVTSVRQILGFLG